MQIQDVTDSHPQIEGETGPDDSPAWESLSHEERLVDLQRRVNEHCALVDATVELIAYERKLYGLDTL
jgi:hypothetical protein